ncbi:unnamed protein product [Bursaphelenchus okinawaensis]|uniref:Basement membrane proteoglycan n=1 Tax=Bursaphelenchus okinawaensis TaxID=465554 RepID=A0A811K9H6_9BILA|nr:unnamed protein product [Bursaphelenchus okinawaensis]CAG9097346.1 unnamed protein product [Bursaphelenchus okinawaensis]
MKSLGDVNWQIAVERDTQEGYALEVEQCSCPPGYTGLSCEDCAPGYERSGQGPYLGTCIPIRERPRPQISCGPGAVAPTTQDRCECKPNVVGLNCDRCAPNTFGLSAHNPQGCNRCWCAGVTGTCDSSSFRRAQVEVDYQRGAQDQLQVQTNDIESPFQPSQQPRVTGSSISFDGFSEARGQPLYWKLPAKFAGDKVTSYGGNLEYSGRCSGSGEPTPDAAVIIRGNNVVLHHQSRQPQTAEQEHRVSIPITEQSFTRADGQPASREDLLMALADVDDVLVKSTCVQDTTNSELYSVKLDYAEPYGSGANAVEVEQCQCPIGYVGPSCEDCAPGYSRVQGGPYLGLCQKCDCNGHASQCDSQYGTCLNCQHNTEGDHCERCAPGFVGDARRGTPHDCQPEQVKPPCQCHNHSPRGCDSFGRCLLCEHNTEGFHCEACKKGFYGDATRGSPYDCTPCPCPGAADCFLDNGGQVQCRNCPAGYAGRLCDECAPGYTRSQQSGGRECEPIGRVEPDRVHFVDNPAVPLRVEILAPKHLVIHEGQRAKWTCQVVGHKPENVDVSWIKVGEGELPPHVRVHNTNQIVIDQVRHSDQGQYRCIGTSKIDGTQASDDATLQISRPPQLPASPSTGPVPQPVVTPPQQTVNQHQSATFTCLVPGFADCEVVWHFNEINGALPPGVHRRGNQIFIPQAEQHHVGNYICTVANQYGQGVSNPGHLDVNKPDMRPIADPPVQTVSVNDPARFRCWVPGHPDAKITWRPEQGSSLPQDVEQRDGILNIPHAQQHHAQRYICSASDPSAPNRPPVDANPVQLVIKAPDAPVAPQVDPLHQQVPKGSPARFRCWVPGKPDAQVKWSVHGGGALPEGAVDKDGVLEFPSVDDFHAGGYVCSVFNPENGQPIDSPVARLDVKQPLNPQVDPREQTVPEGNPAKIRCWVDGVPNALLRWNVKGGRPLPAGARDDGRGNLYIDRVGQEHATDYECTAYDPVDRTPAVSEPANIQVQRAEQPQVSAQGRPPRPVATPPVITVKRGDPARFHCDPNSDVPAEVHWGYGSANGPLEGDVSQNGDDVIINSADDSNAGEYYCQATNEFGTGQAEPVKLVIVDDEEVIPPTARVEPKVWNGEPGETHQFKCIVTGTPHPTIKWVGPDGSSLPEGVVDLGEGILEISKAKKSLHDGDYTCTASNEHGEASDKGTANINPSIKIIIDKPETGTPLGPRIVLTVGEPLEIRCTAHGEPDPDVEWLHDPGPERGDLPDDYVPITISEQFIRHPAIGLGNAGRYTCKGSNQFSTVTKDIYVEVVEATARTTVAIIGGSNQFFPTNQPAQILCTATGASLVDRIEWTRLDGGLPDGVEAHNEPGLLHFEQFRESDAGEYECRAYRKEELIASSTVHVYADNRTPADVAHVEISAPSVRVVNKGDSIVLDCLVHGGHDSELKYRWSLARGGSVVKQLGEEAQLTIKSADPTNDYGIYRCEVDNDDGDTLGSAQAAVSVGYDASTNPEEAKFEEESEAVLICPVFTVPGATVTWYKHSGELPKEAEQNGNKLTIPLFTEETAGLYTCTVQYGQSTVEGYINAKIFVPDTTIQVVLNVSSESVREGDRVWLDCVVTGDPTAKIEFSKVDADELPSGAQITECDDLAREKKVTGNRLLFTSVTADDAGKYQCRAYITGGFLDTSALLSVEPAKRKRKRLSRQQRRRLLAKRRHRRRHSEPEAGFAAHRQHDEAMPHSLFGRWFASI